MDPACCATRTSKAVSRASGLQQGRTVHAHAAKLCLAAGTKSSNRHDSCCSCPLTAPGTKTSSNHSYAQIIIHGGSWGMMRQTCFDSMVSLQTASTFDNLYSLLHSAQQSARLPNAKHLHSVKQMRQHLEHFLDSGFCFVIKSDQKGLKTPGNHCMHYAHCAGLGQAVCLIGKSRCVSDPILSLLVYKHHLRFGRHKTYIRYKRYISIT